MQRNLPLWVTGLSNLPLGFFYGFVNTAMPLLLSAQGVSVARIATISAIAFSPSFWAFLLAPIVDVGFSRKTWTWIWLAVMAACLAGCLFLTGNLLLFTIVITTGTLATSMFAAASGGWLVEIVDDEHFGRLGSWYQIANLGGSAIFGVSAAFATQHLPPVLAAVVVVALFLLPTVIYLLLPEPVAITRHPREVFRNLFRDVAQVVRRRQVFLALVMFLLPAGSFALNNVFSGLGADFHTPNSTVALICGAGVAIAASLGCLVAGPLADRFSRVGIYLFAGTLSATATVAAVLGPRTTFTFAALVLAYDFCQGISFTAFSAINFHLTGRDNPIAATQLALLFSASNLPISYLTWLDGRGYAGFGLHGLLLVDAAATFVFGALLFAAFYRFDRASLRSPLAK